MLGKAAGTLGWVYDDGRMDGVAKQGRSTREVRLEV